LLLQVGGFPFYDRQREDSWAKSRVRTIVPAALHLFTMSLRQSASRPALQHIALALLLTGAAAYGQYGVSPSVTGMFFNDLRYRATENSADTGAVNGDYVYDYSQGAYVGPDGAAATNDGVSAGANQGNPLMAAGNGYTNFSQRQAGDYTQYSGPYLLTPQTRILAVRGTFALVV
jgi:hypothetical protein